MSNAVLIAFTWSAFALHVLLGVAAYHRWSTLPLLPLLNLAVALCVLAFWLPKWYSYVSQSITWYASDQLLPLVALLIGVMSVSTLSGRYVGAVPHWIVFAFDASVLLAAALFFSLFRMDRLL